MLVLSRKLKEEILIGDNIIIKVVRIKGETVRLAIQAPPHVKIWRSEILGGTPKSQEPQS